MTINKIQESEKITFILVNRLDTTAAPQLQEALIHAFDQANTIYLDITKLAYVSSAGLRVLLLGQKAAKSKGASMTLFGVSEEIKEVFDVTGFSDILKVVYDEGGAL